MKHCKIILLVGLLASSASALAEKIGVSMAYASIKTFSLLSASPLRKKLKPATSTYSLKTPAATPGRQADQVQSFIASGVDAIIVDPVDSASTPQLTKMAQQAKMPLVYVNRTPGIKRYRPAWCLSVRTSGSLAHCRWRRWRSWQTTKATSPS